MQHYQLRSPWEQWAAANAWDHASAEGLAPLFPESNRPRNPSNSCIFWFPMWYGIEDWWPLHAGRPIPSWNAKLYGVLWSKGPWIDLAFEFGNMHLASPRLQRAINSAAPGKVQWLPFRLRDPYGKRVDKKYAMANYLELRDVIDRQKSELEPGEKWRADRAGRFELKSLVLSRKKIGNASLFRVYGWPDAVVVNDDVRLAIDTAGVRGCSFAKLPLA